MPSNRVSINGQESLSWEVPDSKMEAVISVLDVVGERAGFDEQRTALWKARGDHDRARALFGEDEPASEGAGKCGEAICVEGAMYVFERVEDKYWVDGEEVDAAAFEARYAEVMKQVRVAEHFKVFREADGAIRATSRFGTASVTKACVINMKLQRGVHLNLLMEDLKDRVAEDGHEAIVREIGLLVFGLIEVIQKEEAKLLKGFDEGGNVVRKKEEGTDDGEESPEGRR
jgi:hypothetical protein